MYSKDTQLNSHQYGEEKLSVLPKKTTADVANMKPARGRQGGEDIGDQIGQ